MKKLRLKETVVVEGRYDRQKLTEVIESPVVETSGFRVFKDKEKQNLLRRAAEKNGILILTDSDAAGFVIRNFLKGIIPSEKIKNCYVPEILGKERRKAEPSKEGKLGVEGMTAETLFSALLRGGATVLNAADFTDPDGEKAGFDLPPKESRSAAHETADAEKVSRPITKSDLYDLGLIGQKNSAKKREAVLKSLGFPTYLSTNAMVEAFNASLTLDELEENVRNTLT